MQICLYISPSVTDYLMFLCPGSVVMPSKPAFTVGETFFASVGSLPTQYREKLGSYSFLAVIPALESNKD